LNNSSRLFVIKGRLCSFTATRINIQLACGIKFGKINKGPEQEIMKQYQSPMREPFDNAWQLKYIDYLASISLASFNTIGGKKG